MSLQALINTYHIVWRELCVESARIQDLSQKIIALYEESAAKSQTLIALHQQSRGRIAPHKAVNGLICERDHIHCDKNENQNLSITNLCLLLGNKINVCPITNNCYQRGD